METFLQTFTNVGSKRTHKYMRLAASLCLLFFQYTRNLAGSVFPKDERCFKMRLIVVIEVAGDGSTSALSKTS